MAPEMLPPSKYNEKADIWSCGVVMYLLITKIFPFRGRTEKELFSKIRKQGLELPLGDIFDVIRGCLEKEQENRMNANDLLNC